MLKEKFMVAAFIPLSMFHAPVGKWPDPVSLRIGSQGCQDGVEIKAGVAQNEATRARGLGGRAEPLKANEGMVFLWEALGEGGYFWMKDTLIPLTLLYFNSQGKLISTYEMPVEADPLHPSSYY